MGCPDSWLKIILDESEWVILHKVNIWISRLSRADCPPQCGGAFSNLLEARIQQKGRVRNLHGLPDCPWAGTADFFCIQIWTWAGITPSALRVLRPWMWTGTTHRLSWVSSSLTTEVLELPSLHGHMRLSLHSNAGILKLEAPCKVGACDTEILSFKGFSSTPPLLDCRWETTGHLRWIQFLTRLLKHLDVETVWKSQTWRETLWPSHKGTVHRWPQWPGAGK